MDLANYINISGLCLDVLGAFLMFSNAPKVSYETFLYNKSEHAELARKADRRNRLVKVGMLLIAVGFTLQLVSNFLR